MHSLIIFASGRGSNAQAIIDYFRDSDMAEVVLIVTNNPDAGVLDIAAKEGIPSRIIDRPSFRDAAFVEELRSYDPSMIVLAGFLWKVPDSIVHAFSNKIVNIHPSLLPKYGGKGMYGHHVHEAVLASGDKKSGITIHYVNEVYDDGVVIEQETCDVKPGDTPDTLAARIHELEHFYYPRTIEYLLTKE